MAKTTSRPKGAKARRIRDGQISPPSGRRGTTLTLHSSGSAKAPTQVASARPPVQFKMGGRALRASACSQRPVAVGRRRFGWLAPLEHLPHPSLASMQTRRCLRCLASRKGLPSAGPRHASAVIRGTRRPIVGDTLSQRGERRRHAQMPMATMCLRMLVASVLPESGTISTSLPSYGRRITARLVKSARWTSCVRPEWEGVRGTKIRMPTESQSLTTSSTRRALRPLGRRVGALGS